MVRHNGENIYSAARHTVAARQSLSLVCDNYLTSFQQRSDGFHCTRTVRKRRGCYLSESGHCA